jgi:hypothetical protein
MLLAPNRGNIVLVVALRQALRFRTNLARVTKKAVAAGAAGGTSPVSAASESPLVSSPSSPVSAVRENNPGLIISNTHLFWNPKFAYVRLRQCDALLRHVGT